MTENTDQSLAETTPDRPIQLPQDVVETILDLDEVLTSAKLVERTATICLRADLEAEYESVMTELGNMIDANGRVFGSPEEPLYSGRATRAQVLNERANELLAEMQGARRVIRFRGMDEDSFATFEKASRYDNGSFKNQKQYVNQLIARCAISPTLDEADVAKMRKKLSSSQMQELFSKAYEACTVGGLDVPKSLPFSLAQKLQG